MVCLICVIFENFKARRSTKHSEYLLKKSFNTKLKFIRNIPINQQPLQLFRTINKNRDIFTLFKKIWPKVKIEKQIEIKNIFFLIDYY